MRNSPMFGHSVWAENCTSLAGILTWMRYQRSIRITISHADNQGWADFPEAFEDLGCLPAHISRLVWIRSSDNGGRLIL